MLYLLLMFLQSLSNIWDVQLVIWLSALPVIRELFALFCNTDRLEGEIKDDCGGIYEGRDSPGLRCNITEMMFQEINSGLFFVSEEKLFENIWM